MASALDRFERVHFVYKTLNGVDFEAAVLVPKPLAASGEKTKSPLLAHFHGGFLVLGTILEPVFLPLWPLELAEAENAIIVSAAYRLLPEAKGPEILDDLKDYWAWVHSTLPSLISAQWPHISLDLERIAAIGESAGGYLSLQSAFQFPEAKVKVVLAQYCGLFPDIPEYTHQAAEDPSEANAFVDNYLASIKPGAIRLLTPFPELLPFVEAMVKTQRHREFMGDDERMTLNYGLRVAENLPPIWVIQGTEDELVVKPATDAMVARIRKAHPETPLLYSVQPGGHGFDSPHGLSEPYVAEGVEFVRKYWA
ncbi:alpha/beta-hydrolase [Thozetella sp. PMI_491]|nr:alpha/beta-hydrolase [Thozetella sp. PMI_491]